MRNMTVKCSDGVRIMVEPGFGPELRLLRDGKTNVSIGSLRKVGSSTYKATVVTRTAFGPSIAIAVQRATDLARRDGVYRYGLEKASH